MNRRSFFGKLSGAVAGCYLALATDKWKALTKSPLELNHFYMYAKYEIAYALLKDHKNIIPIIFRRKEDRTVPLKVEEYPDAVVIHDEFPLRADFDENGFVFRQPFV